MMLFAAGVRSPELPTRDDPAMTGQHSRLCSPRTIKYGVPCIRTTIIPGTHAIAPWDLSRFLLVLWLMALYAIA